MDDWLKQLQDNIDAAAKDSSQWLIEMSEEVSKEADKLADEWVEASAESFDEMNSALEPALSELNDRLEDASDATERFITQQLTPWIEEVTLPISCTVNPLLQNHPVCVGCKYYNGSNFGDSMLVCAMHPYGPEEKTCADKESVWPVPAE